MQGRRDAGQEGCRTGEMQDRRDAGHEGCRKGGMQDRRYAGQEGCKKSGMQERIGCMKDRWDVVVGCRTGRIE